MIHHVRVGVRFFFVLCLALVNTLSFADSAITLADRFEQQLQIDSSDSTTKLSPQFLDLNTLQGKHIIFVDGIMNEMASVINSYFYDNISEIRSFGISYDHIQLSSRQSIPENANTLIQRILQISRTTYKPLIIIGHSMGGAEALYAMLSSPTFLLPIDNRPPMIDKVVLIEAAIGGSPLANQMNFLGRSLFKYPLGEGLISLEPENAHANFREIYQTFQNQLRLQYGSEQFDTLFQTISQKIFYVRSISAPETPLSWGLRLVRWFFNSNVFRESQPNDGLMAVDDQILGLFPPFGIDLGILNDRDHIELVIASRVSRANTNTRTAFTRALLEVIHQNPQELIKLAPERTYWAEEASFNSQSISNWL